MSTDAIEWTPEGDKEVAKSRGRTTSFANLDRSAVRAQLDASLARFVPCYERGLELHDEPEARAAVEALKKFVGATPSVTEKEAAYALSLLGSRSGDHGDPLAELLVRDRGLAFVVRALVEMWSMSTNYRDPDWPKHEKRLAIWLHAQGDTASANDSSVSHGKSDTADYLSTYARFGTPEQRAEIRGAVVDAWDNAPLRARPALAVAAFDFDLADKVARELLATDPEWHWHYASNALPNLLRDPKLYEEIKGDYIRLSYPYLDNHGIAALPMFVKAFGGKLIKSFREDMIQVLSNVRGPTVARLFVPYAEIAPFTPHIRAYFARYPDLFAEVSADKKLAKYRAQLDKLAKKVGAASSAPSKKPAKKSAKAVATKKSKARR